MTSLIILVQYCALHVHYTCVDSLSKQQVHQQMLSGCAHFLLEVGVVGDEYDVWVNEMRLVCATVRVTVEEGTTTGKRERACKKREKRNY